MSEAADFESLLRAALAPVEPPEHLANRLEHALESITTLAAGELEAWELSAMRDPRNWARPALALIAGTSAGALLAVMRARSKPGKATGPGRREGPLPRAMRGLRSPRAHLPGKR